MYDVLQVPIEVLVCVFKRVSVRDLAAIAKTCRRFRDAVMVDQIWQDICRREYNVLSYDGWSVNSFWELYTSVLHKYGCLLGIWTCRTNNYGGLVYMSAEEGRLLAVEYRAPYSPNILAPLRPKELFSLSLCDGRLVTKCLSGWEADQVHDGSLKIRLMEDGKAVHCEFKCLATQNHNVRSESSGWQNSLKTWLKDEYDDENLFLHHPDMTQLVLAKYIALKDQYKSMIYFQRLELPFCQDGSPVIRPGIYKGTYSAHGLELISVDVSDNRIVGTKVTGDPNIPAGEITFDIDLNKLVQSDAEEPTEEEPEEKNTTEQKPRLQSSIMPFRIPRGFSSDYKGFPKACLGRYHGTGQVAYNNYTNPTMTPGEMVVFNQELVGFLWHELLAFSVYSRCTEEFLQT